MTSQPNLHLISNPVPIRSNSNSVADLARRRALNLSERHTRLSEFIRSRPAFAQSLESPSAQSGTADGIDPIKPQTVLSASTSATTPKLVKSSKGVDSGTLFRGMIIPDKPRPPQSDGPYPSSSSSSLLLLPHTKLTNYSSLIECCMSGCTLCVYDLYADSLEQYHDTIAGIRESLREQNVREEEWPAVLRSPVADDIEGGKEKTLEEREEDLVDVSMDAFRAMEKALKAKHHPQA
ncbi:hypothetical protein SISSUDRAFT_1066770 [Sistotremastrum suecicum HHB10207 ss-3]|uniref:Oxidoreductase-like domain-containing protein n=1 Tax=Sistotremastrum suecicum HHB10207 ss-3 TaxID=1314776 RepID=A0A165XX68_9AGAM|nr:hypothetical protein SISSUDRAFT_1066770 [Sistotremastrum suecicum HHB10207 ss-3]